MSMGSAFQRLVERNVAPDPSPQSSESELDSLLGVLENRRRRANLAVEDGGPDPIQALRELTLHELTPIFAELKEKYAARGILLDMDATNFLEGGREIRFEFRLDEYRSRLLGTVTEEAIAFHETRHAPDLDGELVSGPMLRLRHLTGQTFREFVCERLALLLRTALRRR